MHFNPCFCRSPMISHHPFVILKMSRMDMLMWRYCKTLPFVSVYSKHGVDHVFSYLFFSAGGEDPLCGNGRRAVCSSLPWIPWELVFLEISGEDIQSCECFHCRSCAHWYEGGVTFWLKCRQEVVGSNSKQSDLWRIT